MFTNLADLCYANLKLKPTMKKFNVILILALAFVMAACGSKGEKAAEKKEAAVEAQVAEAFPVDYPQEVTLPNGFSPSNISEGDGVSSVFGGGERTFKSFRIEKMMPQNRAELVEHYKKLVEDLEMEGNWDFFDDGLGATGTFTKDNLELEIGRAHV